MAIIMDPGRLDERVQLKAQAGRTPDGAGGYTARYRKVVQGEVWAAFEPLQGTEQLRAMQTQANASHRVTIRYRPDVTAAMRLERVRDGRTFKIVAPPTDPRDPQPRTWLVLLCREET